MQGSGRLRVTVEPDGATLSVWVADKGGNPGADMHVYLLPADARFEGQLAARVVQGQAAARKDGRGEGRLQKVVRSLIEQWERSAVSRGKTGAGRHEIGRAHV